jgi:ZIP family zinc transporter
MQGHVGMALLLTTAAGLSTTIGSLLGIVVKRPSRNLLGLMLGFAAGVMILVSFLQLFRDAIQDLEKMDPVYGFLYANVAFAGGMLVFFLLDVLIPHDYEGDHEHSERWTESRLERTGLLTAIGIAIHNFPEGIITFVGTLHDVKLGVALALAIAIHNIPEGIAVSTPVYAATGSRSKAFLWSFLSGVSEPIGALLAAVLLMPFLTPAVMGWTLAAVAGIMVAISLDEIIPTAKSMSTGRLPLLGVALGMLVMAVSLWLLR